MPEPTPFASGRDADVFVIDAERVLRRYREGGDVADEATIMRYVAEFGFPVPRVYEANGADLVMERLDCSTMLEALVVGDLDALQGGALLADLHRQLHELPPRVSADPSARLLHLDLHPGNVMLGPRGPVVIDWRNARDGPADLDLALSALILAQVAVDETNDLASAAELLLTAFLRAAGGDPLRMLDHALSIRRSDLSQSGPDVDRLPAAARLISDSTSQPGILPKAEKPGRQA